MKTTIISLLSLLFLLSFSIYCVSGHAQCLSNCTSNYPVRSNRPSTCCGCCYEEETCHETTVTAFCCPSEHLFCGCTSNRASCSGFINNRRSFDAFGTCFHPDQYSSCCYFPSANIWGVCPAGSQCCPSRTRVTCCGQNQVCASNENDATPLCVPSNSTTVSSSGSPSPSSTNNNNNNNNNNSNGQGSNGGASSSQNVIVGTNTNTNTNTNANTNNNGQSASSAVIGSNNQPSSSASVSSSAAPLASSSSQGNNGQSSVSSSVNGGGLTTVVLSTNNDNNNNNGNGGNTVFGRQDDNNSCGVVMASILLVVLAL